MTSTMRPTFCSWRSFGRTFAGVLTLLVSATGLAGETITYFHNDVVGSPVLATDVNGLQVWKETYRPYGDRLIRSGASSNNTLWFTGKPYDESTGLTYMGARYYDSALGRFMAIDPLPVDFNNLHTFNRYAYASNNPFKFFDPTGMEAACVSYNNCENVQVNEKVVNFMADLMPLVGDAKGFVEAYQDPSVVNTVSAGLGLVPFFGDAASKTLKVGADIAENTTKAAKGATTVVGRTKDLGNLAKGERSLLDRLKPNLGNAKDNWARNSGVLREEMRRGLPIRDASPGDMGGTFLNAERALLRERGWNFNPQTGYWNPPVP